ncbi:MAG: hypothetical protein KGH98_01435 [Candidatus Micrarchaeota archaeon]|nr:hypothetical protein [Candidatus Micrarchaeota archaeon]
MAISSSMQTRNAEMLRRELSAKTDKELSGVVKERRDYLSDYSVHNIVRSLRGAFELEPGVFLKVSNPNIPKEELADQLNGQYKSVGYMRYALRVVGIIPENESAYYRKAVVESIKDSYKAAREIGIEAGMPVSSVYRILGKLRSSKVLAIGGRINPEGKREKLYRIKSGDVYQKLVSEESLAAHYRKLIAESIRARYRSVTDISKETGIPHSTTARTLKAMGESREVVISGEITMYGARQRLYRLRLPEV